LSRTDRVELFSAFGRFAGPESHALKRNALSVISQALNLLSPVDKCLPWFQKAKIAARAKGEKAKEEEEEKPEEEEKARRKRKNQVQKPKTKKGPTRCAPKTRASFGKAKNPPVEAAKQARVQLRKPEGSGKLQAGTARTTAKP
jgi:hypothetical protein